MKLTYRGIQYQTEPATLEIREGEIGGTYRGSPWRVHYLRHIPEPTPVHNLTWRGISYCTGNTQAAQPSTNPQPIGATLSRSWVFRKERQKLLDEAMKAHLSSIRSSLEHRMQVAKAKGDNKLVSLLEAESEQMMTI
ncbi:MAG: DUF4278 domain-containing protein [Symploca sp. SIO2D2]|nr:DUF4278 domain-containing protein [Symploca sp. SIO2D2]